VNGHGQESKVKTMAQYHVTMLTAEVDKQINQLLDKASDADSEHSKDSKDEDWNPLLSTTSRSVLGSSKPPGEGVPPEQEERRP
jgi:hypothetical protein